MNESIENIWKLQSLELTAVADDSTSKQIAGLRARVPAQVLGHYDRLRARRKNGVALVRNQVCTACHMQVPLGMIFTLMRGEDVQLCESCGCYLYLPEIPAPQVSQKPGKSSRKTSRREVHLTTV